MSVKIVSVPEIGPVRLSKRKGARHIRLSVNHDGEVRVTMPHWTPYSAALKFIEQKTPWINANLQSRTLVLTANQPVGKAHRLVFISSPGISKISTRLSGNEARVNLPVGTLPADPLAQKAAKQVGVRALRQEAELLLPQQLERLAKQHGFNYKSITIRQLKGRWGSCNQAGDITLNLFLMQLPWELIDYVIMHELTHTKVLHHQADFWQAMEALLPNAKQLRRQIRHYRPAFT